MIPFLICIGLVVLFFMFPFLRQLFFKPFSSLFYALKDLISYIVFKGYNMPPYGTMACYCGLFGSGKSLTSTSKLITLFLKYNDKMIWIDSDSLPEGTPSRRLLWRTGNFVPVKVRLYSNLELQYVPYVKLESLQQIVDWSAYAPTHRNEFCYVLIDEASSILNSRDFAKNLDFYSINSMLTCRHANMSIYMTSQRFAQIDKLCRSVMQTVVQCSKIWRVIILRIYDAWEVENTTNPLNVKPKRVSTLFCSDKVFGGYDTFATVSAIRKSCESGDMLTTSEILDKTVDNFVPQSEPKRGLFRLR